MQLKFLMLLCCCALASAEDIAQKVQEFRDHISQQLNEAEGKINDLYERMAKEDKSKLAEKELKKPLNEFKEMVDTYYETALKRISEEGGHFEWLKQLREDFDMRIGGIFKHIDYFESNYQRYNEYDDYDSDPLGTLGGEKAQTCQCGLTRTSSRIIGGHDATQRYLFMVSIMKKYINDRSPEYDYHNCGGALIGDRWVLTAGHCIESLENDPRQLPARVVVGGKNARRFTIDTYKYKREVDFMIKHPDYMEYADIGLMRLKEPFRFNSTFTPVCLPPKSMVDFDELLALGWGDMGTRDQPRVLQEATTRYHPNEECKKTFPGMGGDHHLCVHSKDNGICKGDSGGPLIHTEKGRSYLVGVFNILWGGEENLKQGKGHCSKGNYPVYARVTYFLDWILDTIKNNGGNLCSNPDYPLP